MKKIVLFLLLVIVLVACGKKEEGLESNSSNSGVNTGNPDEYEGLYPISYKAENVGTNQEVTFYRDIEPEDKDVIIGNGVKIVKAKIVTGETIIKVDIEYENTEPNKIKAAYVDTQGENKTLTISNKEDIDKIIKLIVFKEYVPLLGETLNIDIVDSFNFKKTYYSREIYGNYKIYKDVKESNDKKESQLMLTLEKEENECEKTYRWNKAFFSGKTEYKDFIKLYITYETNCYNPESSDSFYATKSARVIYRDGDVYKDSNIPSSKFGKLTDVYAWRYVIFHVEDFVSLF